MAVTPPPAETKPYAVKKPGYTLDVDEIARLRAALHLSSERVRARPGNLPASSGRYIVTRESPVAYVTCLIRRNYMRLVPERFDPLQPRSA